MNKSDPNGDCSLNQSLITKEKKTNHSIYNQKENDKENIINKKKIISIEMDDEEKEYLNNG